MILSPRRLTPTVHCTGVLCWQQSVGSQTNSQIFPTSSWLSDASLVISRCQLRALSSCAGCRHTSNCISINHQGWSLCISSVNRKEKSPAHNQWQMTQNLRRAFFNIINSDNVEIIRSFSIWERLLSTPALYLCQSEWNCLICPNHTHLTTWGFSIYWALALPHLHVQGRFRKCPEIPTPYQWHHHMITKVGSKLCGKLCQ